MELPLAVAKAAMESGVAARPIEDLQAYHDRLSQFVFRSGFIMKPIFERAKERPMRVVFGDGEEIRVLRAVHILVEEGLLKPILIGRPEVIQSRIDRLGLALNIERDVELCNPQSDPRYNDYVAHYQERMSRKGVTPEAAREIVRTRSTVIAAVMVDRGEADAMIAGPTGSFSSHLEHVQGTLGLREDMHDMSTLHLVILDNRPLFVADTYVTYHPSAEELAETTVRAADMVRWFGIEPRVALLSHSNFGTRKSPSVARMQEALALLRERAPDLEVDGEMHADTALVQRNPRKNPAAIDPEGRRQSSDHAGSERGEYRLQPSEGGDRLGGDRAGFDGAVQARPYRDRLGFGARNLQPRCGRGGRSAAVVGLTER